MFGEDEFLGLLPARPPVTRDHPAHTGAGAAKNRSEIVAWTVKVRVRLIIEIHSQSRPTSSTISGHG